MPEARQEHWLWINWSFDQGYSSISERNDELNKGYLASSVCFPTPILEKGKDSMWGELTVGRCLMQLGQLRLVKRKLKLNMSRQALYHINVYVSSHFGRSEYVGNWFVVRSNIDLRLKTGRSESNFLNGFKNTLLKLKQLTWINKIGRDFIKV